MCRVDWVLPALLGVACAGGIALDPERRVRDLDDVELSLLCGDISPIAAEARVVDCGDGLIITELDDFECISYWEDVPTTCAVTVAEATACNEARAAQTDEEVCDVLNPPAACAPLAAVDCQPVE